jgi:hypothetical protein
MAGKLRVEVNSQGAAAILNSPAVAADLLRRAHAIADASNAESEWGGYNAEDASGKRARAKVWCENAADEARQQRLIKNLDAGRS